MSEQEKVEQKMREIKQRGEELEEEYIYVSFSYEELKMLQNAHIEHYVKTGGECLEGYQLEKLLNAHRAMTGSKTRQLVSSGVLGDWSIQVIDRDNDNTCTCESRELFAFGHNKNCPFKINKDKGDGK